MPDTIVIFIDGENVSHQHAAAILRTANTLGNVILARVYGDVMRLNGWLSVPGLHPVHSDSGKNFADMQVAVDAIEVSFMHPGATFLLATSDRDFTPLARRLRERGHRVTGLGDHRAPETWRAACSAFHELDAAKTAHPAVGRSMKEATQSASTDVGGSLDRQIRSLIAEQSQQGRGIPIATMAGLMQKRHGVQIAATKEKRWRPYLAARPDLYELDPKGPHAHVRFRPEGFARLAH